MLNNSFDILIEINLNGEMHECDMPMTSDKLYQNWKYWIEMIMLQVPGLNTPQLDDRQLLHLGGHEGDDDEDDNDNDDDDDD